MNSFNFLKKNLALPPPIFKPTKSFLHTYQDVTPNITQLRTSRKFLHKYVKNANVQWTALISWKKIWIYHHLFLGTPKSFLDPYQDVSPNIMQPRTNGKFLNKYVKTANRKWTALISSKKSGITTTYF